MKVAVIGAGAAGLFSCLMLKGKCEITLYEKLNILGKKLSITGNGKGNITNLCMDSSFYNREIKQLSEFTPSFLIDLLKNYNIFTYADNCGRVYPYTSSKDFTEIIINQIKNDVLVINEEVLEINEFVVTKNSKLKYDFIILANGSNASNKLYKDILVNLKKKEFKPGLTQILVNKSDILNLSGIKVKAKAKLFLDDLFIKEETGEMLFKEDSLSGIMTMQLSSYISRINHKKKHLIIDFFPDLSIDELRNILFKIKENNLSYLITDSLKSLLNPKIVLRIIENLKIRNIYKELDIYEFSKILKNYRIDLIKNNTIDNSQVAIGGILFSEINELTFESKIKNLYVVGEALDVDGLSGGYNLHFAFLSSYYATKSIGEKLC